LFQTKNMQELATLSGILSLIPEQLRPARVRSLQEKRDAVREDDVSVDLGIER
jgi:hypothetical protein